MSTEQLTQMIAKQVAQAVAQSATTLPAEPKPAAPKQEIDYSKLSKEQLIAMLTAKQNRDISFKVSEKGAISVYGLNSRMPVTLYVQQWERLLAKSSELLAFAKANGSKLSRK